LTIAVAVASVATTIASAHAGDGTPTPAATPTPDVPQLTAPTDLAFDGDATVSWTDNATGEDAYQVALRIDDRRGAFSLPANSTSIVLPDFARVDCTMPPFQGSMVIDVYATAGDLAGDAAHLEVTFDCPQAFASPTAAPPIRQTPVIEGLPVLPATGAGGTDSGDPGVLIALGALGIAVAAVSGLVTVRLHHRADPDG
jgi:hypothetical protein